MDEDILKAINNIDDHSDIDQSNTNLSTEKKSAPLIEFKSLKDEIDNVSDTTDTESMKDFILTDQNIKALEEQYYMRPPIDSDEIMLPDIGDYPINDIDNIDNQEQSNLDTPISLNDKLSVNSNLNNSKLDNKLDNINKHVKYNDRISKFTYDSSPKSSVIDVEDDKPRFDKINRINVAIRSLKNKLHNVTNIEDLSMIAKNIAELEHQAVVEKSRGYKQLEKRRKDIEEKIDTMKRKLQRAESELQQVDNSLYNKVNGYRKLLQMRINMLHEEYT